MALIVAQDLQQREQRNEIQNDIQKEKNAMKKRRREQQAQQAQHILEQLNPHLQCSVELAQEKGSSAWLTVLPVTEHGFFLHKGEFRDAGMDGTSVTHLPHAVVALPSPWTMQ